MYLHAKTNSDRSVLISHGRRFVRNTTRRFPVERRKTCAAEYRDVINNWRFPHTSLRYAGKTEFAIVISFCPRVSVKRIRCPNSGNEIETYVSIRNKHGSVDVRICSLRPERRRVCICVLFTLVDRIIGWMSTTRFVPLMEIVKPVRCIFSHISTFDCFKGLF